MLDGAHIGRLENVLGSCRIDARTKKSQKSGSVSRDLLELHFLRFGLHVTVTFVSLIAGQLFDEGPTNKVSLQTIELVSLNAKSRRVSTCQNDRIARLLYRPFGIK